jgi:AraC-like DNA-binding protein/mannose-6-phosphate isomerase-like protein (cupin superfamily)
MDPRFETVQPNESSSFRSIHFSCNSFAEDHTWHYHPELELTWIIRSAGTRFIGDNIEAYQPSDLVLVGANLPHCWHNEGRDKPELIVLQFRPDAFGSNFIDLPEAARIRAMFDLAQRGLHVFGRTASRVSTLMQDVVDRKGMERLIGLLEILNTLAHSAELRPLASADYQINNDITEANRQRIEFVHRYVRENLHRDLSQAEVAQRVGLTASAFSRFFRKATGQTFVGFVNLLRINEVCRRLMAGTMSITDIAMSCGYNNIANFNRQFLAQKGMNPTKFRAYRERLLEHRHAAQ